MRSCLQCLQIYSDESLFCPIDGHRLCDADTAIGDVVDEKYRLVDLLGSGGCGRVYRAVEVHDGQHVAVKILHSTALHNSEYVTRFVREALAAAHLSHRHIVRIFGSGHTRAGLPYIAMQWVQGEVLGRQHSSDYVTEIGRQLADALAEAHSHGIVHRDLKPDNVIVTQTPNGPSVTICDFGIAKLGGGVLPADATQLTEVGRIYGTPAYMSPEQAQGLMVDHRSDLYSLGLILYEILSGHSPFPESSGLAILVDHIQAEIPSLSELVPDANPALVSLIMSLLQKNPAQRPQSATAVCRSLLDIQSPASPMRHSLAPRRAVVALAMAVGFLCSTMGQQTAENTTTGPHSEVATAVSHHRKSHQTSGTLQRALMMTAEDYTLRMLVPEAIKTGAQEFLVFEIWDPQGHPLTSPLALEFIGPNGFGQIVAVQPKAAGHYDVLQKFTVTGNYQVQVRPKNLDITIGIYFTVVDGHPNS